jgi:SAM-dependent methyltransferase
MVYQKLKDLEVLQCPCCQGLLRFNANDILCTECQQTFPVQNGVPLFSIQDIEGKGMNTSLEKIQLKDLRVKYPFLIQAYKWFTPPTLNSLRRKESRIPSYTKIATQNPNHIVLDMGAGRKKEPDVIALDLYPFAGIEVCANAERLPFKDDSVDMVISDNSMEHVSNADAVLKEMRRIIKPGGLVYIIVPFLFPYHPEPFDFKRWTSQGMQNEFPNFKCLEMGSFEGPHGTVFQILTAYFSWMLSFNRYPLYLVWKNLLGWLFLPFRLLEVLRGFYSPMTPLDSKIYYVGEKMKTENERL